MQVNNVNSYAYKISIAKLSPISTSNKAKGIRCEKDNVSDKQYNLLRLS